MMGESSTIGAAPARKSAPAERIEPATVERRNGKDSAASGERLPPSPPPTADMARVAERLDELLARSDCSLRFQVDEATGRTIITVINESTQEVVRQIPSEELQAIAASLEKGGFFVDAVI